MATKSTWDKNVQCPSILDYILNMNSSTGSSRILSTNPNTMSPARKCPSSQRTPSISSLSSLSSTSSLSSFFLDDDSPVSPVTPLGLISGVPFSWEQLPGVPKKQKSIKKKDSTATILLPLPPQGSTPPSAKRASCAEAGSRRRSFSSSRTSQRDPFLAALAECSKDDQDVSRNFWAGDKMIKSINGRLGFVNLSCKNTCAVSESVVYLPRPRRASCDLTNLRLI